MSVCFWCVTAKRILPMQFAFRLVLIFATLAFRTAFLVVIKLFDAAITHLPLHRGWPPP